jgi:hypothetical protein
VNDTTKREGFSLDRWSRRKHAAKRGEVATSPSPEASEAMPAVAPVAAVPAVATASPPPVAAPPEAAVLPPVDSLTPQSDFTAFMRPEVDESLKRAALKKLFADPHFNVMDGLDTYIDDYSKPDPIPPDMLARLMQNRALFDPPRTRVNAQGVVEDVPEDETAGDGTTVAQDARALPPVAAATTPPAAIGDAAARGVGTPIDRGTQDREDGSSP